MNKFKQSFSLVFINIIIPIIITLLSKWLIGLCIGETPINQQDVSSDTQAYQLMISSFSDIFEWTISSFIGVLSYFFIYTRDIESNFNNFKADISQKLVSTNAVIANPETKKIAITAQELDFYERKIYEEIENYSEEEKKNAKSIDILRWYSIQDLLFSPMYLNYFFNRGKQIGHPVRVIVIEKVCLATISFLFLNLKANYKTYIITNQKFKIYCSNQKVINQKVLKGNPYLINISNKIKYGKYTNTINNEAIEIANKDEFWNISNGLISLCENITNIRDTFSIRDIENLLNGR